MARQDVLKIISEEAGQTVGVEDPFDTLPLDSLDFVALIQRLEDATGKPCPPEKFSYFSTVGEVVEFFSEAHADLSH